MANRTEQTTGTHPKSEPRPNLRVQEALFAQGAACENSRRAELATSLQEHVGYLVPWHQGYGVRCLDCGPEHSGLPPVYLYRVNIYPYPQHCLECQRVVSEGYAGWPELFDGKVPSDLSTLAV